MMARPCDICAPPAAADEHDQGAHDVLCQLTRMQRLSAAEGVDIMSSQSCEYVPSEQPYFIAAHNKQYVCYNTGMSRRCALQVGSAAIRHSQMQSRRSQGGGRGDQRSHTARRVWRAAGRCGRCPVPERWCGPGSLPGGSHASRGRAACAGAGTCIWLNIRNQAWLTHAAWRKQDMTSCPLDCAS